MRRWWWSWLLIVERPQTCRFAPGPPRGMRKLGSGPAFSHERPQTCRFAPGPEGGQPLEANLKRLTTFTSSAAC
jgi:hypothetical protein